MSCEWPVDRTCLPELPAEGEDGYEAALANQSRAEDTAIMVLYSLTAGVYGLCDTVVRPCPPSPGGHARGFRPWSSALLWWDGASWFNASCGCLGRCRMSGPGMVHLPGPAQSVNTVIIGDVVLDEAEYVLEGSVLYRRGGKSWPNQDLSRPMGEAGTWSVDYVRGLPVPAGGDKMAGILAQEFINACDGEECRLPRSVVQTTRQGVTHSFDATKILQARKVGIPEIDLWLSAVNPHGLTQPPVVL